MGSKFPPPDGIDRGLPARTTILVISGNRMPEVDGIEAAICILAKQPTPNILVSAFHDEDLVQRAAQSQAMTYLVKPIERADLGTAISMAGAVLIR